MCIFDRHKGASVATTEERVKRLEEQNALLHLRLGAVEKTQDDVITTLHQAAGEIEVIWNKPGLSFDERYTLALEAFKRAASQMRNVKYRGQQDK